MMLFLFIESFLPESLFPISDKLISDKLIIFVTGFLENELDAPIVQWIE